MPTMARLTRIIGSVLVAGSMVLAVQLAHGDHHKDDQKQEDGFTSLLKGKNLSQWTTEGNWSVDGNKLIIEPREGEHGWRRFEDYIYTKKKYGDFALRLEYKLPENGNSGIFFRIEDREDPVNTGIEAQIWDKTYGKPDDQLNPHDSGGLISAVAPSTNAIKPAGEWNAMKVKCRGRKVMVYVNGEKVVDANIDKTPLKNRPDRGYIALQDHGLPMTFRNVEIKTLD
jgi:hypothetical protein